MQQKIDLITLYGKLGLPYFDETQEEFEEDLAVLKKRYSDLSRFTQFRT
ncbi:MAG: hypothetical protein K2N51_08720 [Lachnospiraceae bacterium]|nr:hypothetical protein [Lachnospiraceae bacterium]